MTVPLDQLPPAARRKALEQAGRRRRPRQTTFPKNRARSCAIRVLATVAELTQDQRERVLRLALKMNEV
jgi:hypothetical protein